MELAKHLSSSVSKFCHARFNNTNYWDKTFRARVVYREAWSEGSETAKPGTDEQNVHKRYVEWGKQKISPESGTCNFPVLKE